MGWWFCSSRITPFAVAMIWEKRDFFGFLTAAKPTLPKKFGLPQILSRVFPREKSWGKRPPCVDPQLRGKVWHKLVAFKGNMKVGRRSERRGKAPIYENPKRGFCVPMVPPVLKSTGCFWPLFPPKRLKWKTPQRFETFFRETGGHSQTPTPWVVFPEEVSGGKSRN